MRGRLLAPSILLLLLAGCVAPAADVSPASLAAALDDVRVGDAAGEALPNGDRLFALVGETDAVEELDFTIPAGLHYVEVAVREPATGVGVSVVDKASGVGMCRGVRYQAWYGPIEEPFRCGALALGADGATWTVRITNLLPADDLGNVPPVSYDVAVTLSAQPVDGPAAALKPEELSRPIFDVLETESFKVPASTDGSMLHVEVTRPDTDAPVPVLMIASPYNTPERAVDGYANKPYAQYFASRGYAFATMDLRGTGISAGCFSMRGAVDQVDLKDVVDWLGTQDWSDGKVGMFGVSYEGFTPVAAAVAQPEHLTAIFAGAPAIDMYANYLPGGVNTGRTFSTGMLGYVVGNAADTTDDPSNPIAPVEYRADALCDPLAITMGNDPRDLYSEYFVERNLTELVGQIQVPVYLEQGFWDNNVKANPIPDFFNALQVPKRGVFGSWEHAFAVRADQWVMMQAWFDHWLLGRDTGIQTLPAVDVTTNTRQHRVADAWPAANATAVDVPIAGGSYLATPAHALPLSTSIETASEPFAEGLYVSGVPTYTFPASLARGGSTYFYAELYEETADGERSMIIMGWLHAAHLDNHKTYAPLTAGETRDFELQLLPVDHVVAPGSKLVLALRSTDANDGYGGPEGGLTEPGLVAVGEGVLRLPTLPLETLTLAPRSVG